MLYLDSPREDVWTKFLSGERIEASAELVRTWSRSLLAGVDWRSPKHSTLAPVLDRSEARHRQEAGERGWRHAKPMLEQLSSQLADNGFLGVWADPDGIILHRRGGGQFLSTAQRVELLEGANWSESVRGTNAIGTALREGCEVAVLGRAHLQKANHGLVCYAAPVYSPYGELVGVFDVTSHVATAQNLAWAAVVAARVTIEQGMKFAAYNEAIHGGLESMGRLIEACTTPAFLIERDGTLRLANTKACARFGKQQPPTPNDLNWLNLATSDKANSTIELTDNRGGRERLRPIVEPVGTPEKAMAALVRLEPVGKRVSVVSAMKQHRKCKALEDMYCADEAVLETLSRVTKLAPTELPILLLAETGTGKERIARALHQLSKRAEKPFVPINCGALSESLLESELFGYGPGAFTGAQPKGARGKIDLADGGTLFLDEVADMSLGAQTRLLRVLENGSYFRVGETIERHADVRVVAATCRPIEKMVHENLMRADLFYRLKGAILTLPPVRSRTDLRVLAEGLIRDLASTLHIPVPVMTRSFVKALHDYHWPGNVRELKNTLHVTLVLSDGARLLQPEHLPDDIRPANDGPSTQGKSSLKYRAEGEALEAALQKADNMSEAARILGVARSTLYRMLRRHGLRD